MSAVIAGSQPSPSTVLRRFWASIFAQNIRHARSKRRLSVEEAAKLAGMEASEWAAIEAGSVPQTADQLLSMAGTLQISHDRMVNLVLLCQDAWEH